MYSHQRIIKAQKSEPKFQSESPMQLLRKLAIRPRILTLTHKQKRPHKRRRAPKSARFSSPQLSYVPLKHTVNLWLALSRASFKATLTYKWNCRVPQSQSLRPASTHCLILPPLGQLQMLILKQHLFLPYNCQVSAKNKINS